MRFQLRSLLIIVALVAIALGGHYWWKYNEMLKRIPVELHTTPMTETAPPSEVRVAFGKNSVIEHRKTPAAEFTHYRHPRELNDNIFSDEDRLNSYNRLLQEMDTTDGALTFIETGSVSHDNFELLSGHESKRKYISWMFHVADPEAVDYYRKLSEEFPDRFSHPDRIKELLTLLRHYDLGRDVKEKFVLRTLIRNRKVDQRTMYEEVLNQADLHYDVDMLNLVHEQLSEFAILSRGEFDLKHITIPRNGVVAFEIDDDVYEFDVKETDVFFDPHVVADILNSIARRKGTQNRFIAFWTETTDAYIYYGPPELAGILNEQFGIEFMDGTDAYFGDTNPSGR